MGADAWTLRRRPGIKVLLLLLNGVFKLLVEPVQGCFLYGCLLELMVLIVPSDPPLSSRGSRWTFLNFPVFHMLRLMLRLPCCER